eukprot:TRINITY_DN2727_c0_g7_i2.p1 TRINITY_DN2727_c0_g7~~TRINITY_DN2727_c0_g7_i2.p1  ORF type:complete len:431 (+),score=81.58 TRINITY_DN2727_c0_g7_i2:131-1423(+)
MERKQTPAILLVWKFVLIIAAFLILAVVMALVDGSLFQYSIEAIREYSKDWKKTGFDAFMRTYTNAGAVAIIAIGCVYCLLFGPKIKQLMYLNSVLLGQASNAFLKNLYHQYRPCWADLNTPVYGGEKDFGNPSGHATGCGVILFSALAVYLFDNLDFCLTEAEELEVKKTRAGILYSLPAKIIITVVTLFLYLIILYSRVYVGAHSFNQILYGSLLGLFIPVAIFYVFCQNLVSYYKHLLSNRSINYVKNSLIISAIGLFPLLAHIITFIVLRFTGVKLDSKTLAHIQQYHSFFDENVPLNSGFINFGLGEMAIGANLGVLYNLYCFDINPTAVTFGMVFWKSVVRMIVVVAVAAPLPVLTAIFLPVSPPLLIIWVKSVLPGLCSGFILFGFMDCLLSRLKLLPAVPEEKEKANLKAVEISYLIDSSQV